MADSVYDNGGIIGPTMSFSNNAQYVLGSTLTPQANTLIFIGSQTSNGVGTTAITNISFSLTGGETTANTLRPGDVVFVGFATGSTVDRSMTSNVKGSDSVNYTTLADLYSNDTYDTNLFLGYKVMSAIPDSYVSLRQGSFDVNDAYTVGIFAFRNANVSIPINSNVSTITTINSSNVNPVGVTPNTGNSLVLVFAASGLKMGAATFAEYSSPDLNNFKTTCSADDTTRSLMGMGYIRQGSTPAYVDPGAITMRIQPDAATFSSAAATVAIKPSDNTAFTFGNRKNSGIWNLDSVYDTMVPRNPKTFRYLKWTITQTKTANQLMQASEFVLQNNGIDISMTGTTVASSDPGQIPLVNEVPSNLVDNNTGTKYTTLYTTKPVIVTFDLGSSKTVTGYRWATANDNEQRDPADWTVEISSDGTTWQLVSTITAYSATAARRTYTRQWGFEG